MNAKHILLCLVALLCTMAASAQDVRQMRRHVRRGNRMMHTGMLDKAYEEYRKAYEADSSSALVNYNLARSMFPKEWKIMKADEKADSAMLAAFKYAGDEHIEANPLRRSMAWHNMGVIHQIRANQSSDQQKTQQLRQAIKAYQQALRLNPHDDEARYNMVLCQRQLPKGEGNNGDNQQQEQQQQEQQQEQQQQPQQDQQQQQPQEAQDQQQPQDQDMIEQLLNAAEQREKQTRKKIDEQRQNQQGQRRRNEKNW